jgi:hypothetical protein
MATLGDGPIEARYVDQMRQLAQAIDEYLNANRPKQTGFILMVFPFEGYEGRCNYISNAQREDVIVLLKEQLARFSGQPDVTGNA